jgi:hypothetical protein
MRAHKAASARSRGVSSQRFLQSSHLHLSVHFTCALPPTRSVSAYTLATKTDKKKNSSKAQRFGVVTHWKHSQYFLRQCDFLQRQPRACAPTTAFFSCSSSSTILAAKAFELRCLILSTACRRCVSWLPSFSHSTHWHHQKIK